jgi:hypothetical protein
MKKIFFNLQGGKGHNIGLTCDFAEASYIGIRADNLEPHSYFAGPRSDNAPRGDSVASLEIGVPDSQNRCGGISK